MERIKLKALLKKVIHSLLAIIEYIYGLLSITFIVFVLSVAYSLQGII